MTVSGSLENDRSPIAASFGWSLTSTSGAKFIVTPLAASTRPRLRAICCTSAVPTVEARVRALGRSPSSPSTRWTRPPSSSTATASGSRDAACTPRNAWPVSSPVAVPPTKMPPICISWTSRAVAAGSAPLTPTMSRWASFWRGFSDATTGAQSGSRSSPSARPLTWPGATSAACAGGAVLERPGSG